MKKVLLPFLLLTAVSVVKAQPDKQPFSTKSLANEQVKNIEAKTQGGNISVIKVSAAEARIDVFIQANNDNYNNKLSKEEIQRRLDENYELTVSVSNNKLTAIAKPKERNMNWKRSLSISFYVYVAADVSTDLSTSGGNIKLSGLTGTQDFTTSGGNLDLDNLAGKIMGRTSGGNIHLSNLKDDVDLTTSGGNIHADNSSGKIRLATSGGSLRLKQLKGDIRATTSGGSIDGETISQTLDTHTSGGNISLRDLSCSLETSTSGGNIDVSIKEFGQYITITNSSGNIDLQMPDDKGIDLRLRGDKIKTTTLNHFSGSVEEGRIEGKLNGGGLPVKVNAGGGKISLTLSSK